MLIVTQSAPQPGSKAGRLARCSDRETRKLLDACRAAGARVEASRNGHYKVYWRGQFAATIASTPSEYRGRKNDIANLRRVGVPITTKGTYEP